MQHWDNGAALCDRQYLLLQGGQCYSGNENTPYQPKEERPFQANPAENVQDQIPQGNSGSFECKHCNRTFSTKRYLQRHIIIHRDMEQESLSCQLCGRNFTSKAHLDRHKFIHTGQRPFQCNVCGRSFGRKDHLQKHVATLHDENRASNSKASQNAVREDGEGKQPVNMEENRTKVPSGSGEEFRPKIESSMEDDSSLSSGTPTVDECRKRLPSSSLDDFGSAHSSSLDTQSSSVDDYRNSLPPNPVDEYRNSLPSNPVDDYREKLTPNLEDYRNKPSSSLAEDFRNRPPGSVMEEHRGHFSMNYYNEVPFPNHSIRPTAPMYGTGAENFYHYKSAAVDYPGIRKPDPMIPGSVHEDSLPLYMYLREQLDFNKQANFRHSSQDYMFNGSEIVSALHHLNGDVPPVCEHPSSRPSDSRDYAKMNSLLHYDRKMPASELYLDSANANCNECGLKFFNPAALKQHVCVPVAEKIFRCVSCNMIFSDAVALEGHRQPIECTECCTIFSSGCDLEHHKCIPQPNFSNR